MVTPAPKFETPKPIEPRRFCPRCSANLTISYDNEPQCLICGYTDYSYTQPPSEIVKNNLMSRATQRVIRYVGHASNLSETLVHARLQRVRNRVIFDVKCPFCEAQMEQSSLSGKRRERREERYRCPKEHRVSLVPKRGGGMGWK